MKFAKNFRFAGLRRALICGISSRNWEFADRANLYLFSCGRLAPFGSFSLANKILLNISEISSIWMMRDLEDFARFTSILIRDSRQWVSDSIIQLDLDSKASLLIPGSQVSSGQISEMGNELRAVARGGTQPMFERNPLHHMNSVQIRKLRLRAAVCLLSLAAILAANVCNVSAQSMGAVSAWGYNAYGQLGNGANGAGTNSANTNTPGPVSNLLGVTAVTGGQLNSLALKGDGTVWAWGYNLYGQLGNGTNNDSNTPVQVSNLSNVVAIAGGGYHSLALQGDGTVWAWGYGLQGELGDGAATSSNTPVQVGILSTVAAIAAGEYHSLALKADGTVWAW